MYLLLVLVSRWLTLTPTRKPSSFHCRAASRGLRSFCKRETNTGWSFLPAGWHANNSAVEGSDCALAHIINPRDKNTKVTEVTSNMVLCTILFLPGLFESQHNRVQCHNVLAKEVQSVGLGPPHLSLGSVS